MNQMADVMESDGFSLAALADLDVSGIEEIRFEQLPSGSYEFEVTEAEYKDDEKDGETRVKVEVTLKILEVKAVLEPGVDKDSLVGKSHTERYFIKPGDPADEVAKQIGRIRAFITDMGANSEGKFGEIITNLKGHTFVGKITKRKDKNDPTVSYARLQLEPKKK
jgi:hypothetical protein